MYSLYVKRSNKFENYLKYLIFLPRMKKKMRNNSSKCLLNMKFTKRFESSEKCVRLYKLKTVQKTNAALGILDQDTAHKVRNYLANFFCTHRAFFPF